MNSHEDTLKKLTIERESNINKLINWSFDDFTEMLETYKEAKIAASELGDTGSVAILNEKISQLEASLKLKKQNSDISI